MKFKDGDRVIAIRDSCWVDTGILGTVTVANKIPSYPYIVVWDTHYSGKEREPYLMSHTYREHQLALVWPPLNKVHYRLSLDLHLPPLADSVTNDLPISGS